MRIEAKAQRTVDMLGRVRTAGVAVLAPRGDVLGEQAHGGSTVMLWEHVNALKNAGIGVRVYARAARDKSQVHTLRTRTSRALFTSLEYCGQFALRERRAILIGYNEPTVAGLAAGRSIVRFGWPTPLPRYWRLPGCLRRFQQSTYLFPSEYMRDQFLRAHPLIAEAATVVIPNGVDLTEFRPREDRSLSDSCVKVGYAGQFIREKGVGVLCDAWQTLRDRGVNSELWLAGGRNLWKRLHPAPGVDEVVARVNEIEKEGSVRLVGEVPRSQIPEFWRSVDIAVMPSVCEEAFGLSALEAMASGIPVVASRVGGLKELIAHEQSGLLVPPNDAGRLAEALNRLIFDAELRLSLGRGARRRAELFGLDRLRGAMLELVCSVAGRGRCAVESA